MVEVDLTVILTTNVVFINLEVVVVLQILTLADLINIHRAKSDQQRCTDIFIPRIRQGTTEYPVRLYMKLLVLFWILVLAQICNAMENNQQFETELYKNLQHLGSEIIFS